MSKHTETLELETVTGDTYTVKVPKKISWETTKSAVEALDVDLDNINENSDGDISLQDATGSAMKLYQVLVDYAIEHIDKPVESSELTAESTGKIVGFYKDQVFESIKKNIGQK